MGRRHRLRQHTNPLSYRDRYRGPMPTDILGGPPTELEIGPGLGELLLHRARQAPAARLLAIEVRKAYAEICRQAVAAAGLGNVAVLYAEAKSDVPDLVEDDSLDVVYVMFPDPWFKPRHRKRRVLDADFCAVLASKLRVGGELHYATDNGMLAVDIRLQLDRATALTRVGEVPRAAWASGRGVFHGGRGHTIFGGRYARLTVEDRG